MQDRTWDLPVVARRLAELRRAQSDIVVRSLPGSEGLRNAVVLLYCSTLADMDLIHMNVLTPLVERPDGDLEGLLPVGKVTAVTGLDDALQAAMTGDAVLFRRNRPALVIAARKWPSRPVDISDWEPTSAGPKESFSESLQVNIGLIRKRLPHTTLRLERIRAGRHTQADVLVIYLADVVDKELQEEIRARVQSARDMETFDVSDLEDILEDPAASLFPTVQRTERPDTIARACLEGRVAVLAEGASQALAVPGQLFHHLRGPDDYYHKPHFIPFVYMMRFAAFIITIFLTALYTAIVSYHQEAIPSRLLVSIVSAREGVPFPVMAEALLMTFLFELFREAGLRMPRIIGPTISIVGGLVIGEAAIRAHLTSPLMVIAVSLTAIGSFAIPSLALSHACIFLRFAAILFAGLLGLFGVVITYLAMGVAFTTLRPYGYPYLFPLLPFWPVRLAEVIGWPRRGSRFRNQRKQPDNRGGAADKWSVP